MLRKFTNVTTKDIKVVSDSAERVSELKTRLSGFFQAEVGLSGSAAPLQPSSPIGSYVMATVEHREPCELRGSRTVLGARGGEIPPRNSTVSTD